MNSPRWMKVVREVRLHLGRTLGVVLAIAVGMVGAGSVMNTYSILKQALGEGYLATNPPSATLRTDPIDEDLLSRVEDLAGVTDVEAKRWVDGRVSVSGAWQPLRLFTMSDFRGNRIGLIAPETGVWPPTDGQIVIEQSSLPFVKARLGDELTVRFADEVRALPITGIARDPGLAPGWMEHVVYGFVTPATLETLEVPAGLDRLQVVIGDNRLDEEEVRRIAFNVKALVQSTGRMVYAVSVPTPGRHIHAEQMDSLLYVQGAFGILAFVLSGLLVVNLMSAILAGQVREIGVMKAVGARTAQVAGIYLALALVLGLAASAVAMPVAAWIGRAYAGFAAGMLNFDISGYRPARWVTWLQLAVGALLPVVSAMIPVWLGARVTVSQALRDYGIRERHFGSGLGEKILSRISGPARPMLLSLRNTFRRPFRLTLTLLALSVGGAVFLGALNLRAAIRRTMDTTFATIEYDITVHFARSYPVADIERALADVSGVVSVEAWEGVRASLAYDDGTQGNAFSFTTLPAETRMVGYPVVEGRWLRPGDTNALVVNNQLVDAEPRVRVGEEITLVIAGEEWAWRVVGVVISSPSVPVVYASRAFLAARAGEPSRADRALIASDGDLSGVRRRVVQTLEEADLQVTSAELVERSRAVVEDHLLMVASFLLVMSLLIIIVGGLGLATTMSLAVLERTREIGVMRAIGAAHHTIHRLVLAEGICIGILSYLIAIPLSVPMSAVVGNGFGQIAFQAPVVYVTAPSGLLAWFAIVMLLSIGASFIPARNATRRSTAEALAYG